MDEITKSYIESLNSKDIPWERMITAYGIAENYNELLLALEQTDSFEEWKRIFNRISDFEHQGTMFPPAPFILVFLVRLLEKLLQNGRADDIAEKLIEQFTYYADVCNDAKERDHAQPLSCFSDLLNDENLLPEECTDEDINAIFEDPDAISEELFFSFYYYSEIVISQVPDILDRYGKFSEKNAELRSVLQP